MTVKCPCCEVWSDIENWQETATHFQCPHCEKYFDPIFSPPFEYHY